MRLSTDLPSFLQLTKEIPVLFRYFRQIEEYCVSAYGFENQAVPPQTKIN